MGPHTPVLLNEAVEALAIRPEGVYIDCTFGRGGHSQLILERLSAKGRLVVLDKDPSAIEVALSIKDDRLQVAHCGFSTLKTVLYKRGINSVDGVLLDLGTSSPQLEEAGRGFSFRVDGPLDMRMDTTRGETAAEWLAVASESEIGRVIRDYGEERFAKQIARAIVAARARHHIATSRQLAEIVAKAVRTREPGQDPATRTFQAIRVHINKELEELSLVLPQCVEILRPGGRLVVICFHSLEDRIVKRFLRQVGGEQQLPRRLPVRAIELRKPLMRPVGKLQRPSLNEISVNPRARSAIMRVAERTEESM